jgi:hypothetical protein
MSIGKSHGEGVASFLAREGFLFPTETLPILLPPRLSVGSEIANTTFSTEKSDTLEWMLTTMR